MGYVTLSQNSTILQSNQTFATMISRDLSDILNESFSEFLCEEDRSIFLSRYNAFFKYPVGKSMELKMQGAHGTTFFVRITGTLKEDEEREGEFHQPKLFVIIDDITDLKNAEFLLKQTRRNYELFIDAIDDFLFVLDERGNIIHTNQTVLHRLGYEKSELTGRSVLMLHPEARREEAGQIVREMLLGKAEYCPIPLITKTGTQIPVETRVSHGVWNGLPAIFGVTKDISKLKLSEEKFSKVFFLNPNACGLSDLQDGKYIELNEAFYQLFEFTKEEVLGKTAIELGILSMEMVQEVLKKADSRGHVHNAEAMLKTKSGETKHVLLSAENIFIQDKHYRFTVVNDITERKRAEEEIQQKNRQLAQINASKDKFFSIIAHDLKSPFNGFLGLTQLMAEEMQNLTLTDIREFSVSLQESASNLYKLLENLLEWSRMQRGTTEFNPELSRIAPIVEQNIEIQSAVARQKNITVNNVIPENVRAYIDVSMVNTICRNLLSNALKFTVRGGFIEVGTINHQPSHVCLYVRDNGIGMTQETLQKLFMLDQKISRPGTENEPSTGLGLLLCKEFIEKHGGKIWVESTVDHGTTFYFTLPTGE